MSEMHKEQTSQRSHSTVHESAVVLLSTTISNGCHSTESTKVLRCQIMTLLLSQEIPLECEEGGKGHDNTDENPW